MDLASSQETHIERLSARNRADVLGYAKPAVQGLTKTLSRAAQARADAKQMEEESLAAEGHASDSFGIWRSGNWPSVEMKRWHGRRNAVDSAWAEATRLSLEAGHNFTDRSECLVEIQQESLVARALRFYLSKTRKRSWQHVEAWRKEYKGRPKEEVGPASKRHKK